MFHMNRGSSSSKGGIYKMLNKRCNIPETHHFVIFLFCHSSYIKSNECLEKFEIDNLYWHWIKFVVVAA